MMMLYEAMNDTVTDGVGDGRFADLVMPNAPLCCEHKSGLRHSLYRDIKRQAFRIAIFTAI